MDIKYLDYSLDELLEDKGFVAWCLNGPGNGEWHKFLEMNPGFSHRAKKARKIILLLRDKYEVLDEESVLLMWQGIDDFDKLHQRKARRVKTRRAISWAASFIIAVALGALAYYMGSRGEAHYEFSASEIPQSTDEARLVLSSGESIALQKDNSSVSLNDDNKLVINKDRVIDLSEKGMAGETGGHMNEVVVPYGKKSELTLADGTKVWVNAGSRLAFPSRFTQKAREVYLEGEAYFEVAKNKTQPFIVKAGEVDIKVLGTHFDVVAYKNEASIETILLEGSVAMAANTSFGFGKKEVLLKPYQKASFNKKERGVSVSEAPGAETYIAWTEGWFQFSRESLKSVFTRLERYYNIEIVTSGEALYNELITGKLDLKASLDKVMVALSDVAKIRYQIIGDKIYIEKRIE